MYVCMYVCLLGAAVAFVGSLMIMVHRSEAETPQLPQVSGGVADELAKLAEMRASDVLSEVEFTAAKRRLLDD